MHRLMILALVATVPVFFGATIVPPALAADEPAYPTDGKGLEVGQTVRDAELRTIEDEPVSLRELAEEKGPLIITFYRGGWCPFCNRALEDWQDKLGAIEAAGATFVAITPEKPDLAGKTKDKNKLSYIVLSDAENQAAESLNVLFALDEETQKKYEGYGIDLDQTNGSGEWKLPHPATFIIDREGVVRYAHVDPDYREGRADPDEVLGALKKLE